MNCVYICRDLEIVEIIDCGAPTGEKTAGKSSPAGK